MLKVVVPVVEAVNHGRSYIQDVPSSQLAALVAADGRCAGHMSGHSFDYAQDGQQGGAVAGVAASDIV